MGKAGGVMAGMASFGRRADLLQQAVASLIDQVDRLGVYLNGYSDVPDFLDHPKIEVARSQDHGDIRDNGKFFFLDRGYRCYAAVDDDIVYPPDYIAHLESCLEDAGEDAAVAIHGAVYPSRILGLFTPRHLFHYRDSLPHVMPVHLVGTGTILFDQGVWGLSFDEFGTPGMADVWFAVAARKRGHRLFVANRGRDWLTDVISSPSERAASGMPRLFSEALLGDEVQVAALASAEISTAGFDGLLGSMAKSPTFLERITISQALLLDEVRRAVGYPPLSESAAADLIERLRSSRETWANVPGWSSEDLDRYHRVIVGVLDGTLDSGTVVGTLSRLETSSHSGTRSKLPYALRFDSSSKRLERIGPKVLLRSAERDPGGISVVWPRLVAAGHTPLQTAIEAERAGIDTGFMHMRELDDLGARNPSRAAAWIYEYHEAVGWARPPEVLRWRMILRSAFEDVGAQLLLGMAAARSGHVEYARRVAHRFGLARPARIEPRMLAAAIDGVADPEGALGHSLRTLDEVVARVGVRPFTSFVMTSAEESHWIRRLESSAAEGAEAAPVVSVIMTAFESAGSIAQAVRSVLASQGVPLELIVVDDHSSDGTAEIVGGIDDPRLVVIRNVANIGPYASRNVALRQVRGRYVAIADADDWTHPERLRLQVSYLDEHPEVFGCTVSHVRLRPGGGLDLENNLRFLGHGPVSLVFRRSLLDEVGGFDTVRTRGDMEFMRRVRSRFGPQALARLEVPLVLASSSPASNSKRFPLEALNRYREAFREWHERYAGSEKLFVPLGERAPFVAPAELL